MNPIIAGLIGAAIMYVLAVIVTLMDEWWMDDIFVAPANALFLIVSFPFVFVYKFFRNLGHPVSVERQEKEKAFFQDLLSHSVQIFPGVYIGHDAKAKALANKFFMFRLERKE